MAMAIRAILVILLILGASACSESVALKTYSKNGFSVDLPHSWQLIDDSDTPITADREITLQTGEFSFVGFYVYSMQEDRSRREVSLADFSQRFMRIAFPAFADPEVTQHKSVDINRGGHRGVSTEVVSTLVDKNATIVEIYPLTFDKAKVFAVFFTEDAIAKDVAKSAEKVLAQVKIE